MKPFNLEEYLKNPNRKVVTRDGRNTTIHCTNYRTNQPIIAEIEGENCSESFNKDGKWLNIEDSEKDLFFASKKKEGWINIYKDHNLDRVTTEFIFSSGKYAKNAGMDSKNYITTIKIEWEE